MKIFCFVEILMKDIAKDSKSTFDCEQSVQKANDILNRYSLDELKTKIERVEVDVDCSNINNYIDNLLNGHFKDLAVDYKEKLASIQVTKNDQFYQFEIVDEKKDSFSIYSIKSVRSINKFNISIYGYKREIKLSYYSKLKRSLLNSKDDLILYKLLNIFENKTERLLNFLLYSSFNKAD